MNDPAIEQAAQMAALGLPVFPLAPNSKKPPQGLAWQSVPALADPVDVAMILASGSNYAVKIPPGFVVVDIDAAGESHGADGRAAARELGLYDLATFRVRTPSGGEHLYFRAPADAKLAQRSLAPGLDTRVGGSGYVLGPGSKIDGMRYVVVEDHEFAELPASILAMLGPKELPRVAAGAVEVDSAGALARARAMVKTWRLPMPGERDNECYKLVARLYDLGLSPAAVSLLAHEWNERLPEPLTDAEIDKTVRSGATSRQNGHGCDADAAAEFPDVEPPPAVEDEEPEWYDPTSDEDEEAALEPRRWIVKDVTQRKTITFIGGAGAAGKSVLSLNMALAIALGAGHPLLPKLIGREVVEPPGSVLIVNNEDDAAEMKRRLRAVMKHFGIKKAEIGGRIKVLSIEKGQIKISEQLRAHAPTKSTDWLLRIERMCLKHQIGTVFFDPYVSIHQSAENDNGAMNAVVSLLRSLAWRTGAAILCIHHVTKPNLAAADGYAGNVAALRGASAMKDAARAAFTLFAMTEKDSKALGVPSSERHRYVRFDETEKMNHSLATGSTTWFYKHTVVLANGDTLGALERVKLESVAPSEHDALAGILAAAMGLGEPVSLNRAAEIVKADPFFADESTSTLRRRIKAALQYGRTVGDALVLLQPEGESGGTVKCVANIG